MVVDAHSLLYLWETFKLLIDKALEVKLEEDPPDTVCDCPIVVAGGWSAEKVVV